MAEGSKETKKYIHKVQYYETDKMGMVHHSNHIRWMEEARIDFLARAGWDYASLEERGVLSPVLTVECRYKEPAFFADEVKISVAVRRFTGIRLTLEYIMKTDDGRLICEGSTGHCFVNIQGRPLNLKKEFPKLAETLIMLEKQCIQ